MECPLGVQLQAVRRFLRTGDAFDIFEAWDITFDNGVTWHGPNSAAAMMEWKRSGQLQQAMVRPHERYLHEAAMRDARWQSLLDPPPLPPGVPQTAGGTGASGTASEQ